MEAENPVSEKATARIQEAVRSHQRGESVSGAERFDFGLVLKVKTPGFSKRSDKGHEK